MATASTVVASYHNPVVAGLVAYRNLEAVGPVAFHKLVATEPVAFDRSPSVAVVVHMPVEHLRLAYHIQLEQPDLVHRQLAFRILHMPSAGLEHRSLP